MIFIHRSFLIAVDGQKVYKVCKNMVVIAIQSLQIYNIEVAINAYVEKQKLIARAPQLLAPCTLLIWEMNRTTQKSKIKPSSNSKIQTGKGETESAYYKIITEMSSSYVNHLTPHLVHHLPFCFLSWNIAQMKNKFIIMTLYFLKRGELSRILFLKSATTLS